MYSIVFMGTPDFAVPALNALHTSEHQLLAVVTQPDRPKGRGRKRVPPPVKIEAQARGYEIWQPDSVKSPDFLKRMAQLKPDLFVVIAFGHILPAPLLRLPKHGAINIHASLLPQYRGPAPIQWAIINGESQTGVTAMFMDKGMDTGDILMAEPLPIYREDTADSLHDRLAVVGADLLLKTLRDLPHITPVAQDPSQASQAPMLRKADGHIVWRMPARKIEDFIRGMTPWPGAFTFYGEKRLKLFKATAVPSESEAAPGTVLKSFPDQLRVATGQGALSITEIQGASGKRLPVAEFLRGHPLEPGTVLT